MKVESFLDDVSGHLVGNEPALVEVALHLGAELGPVPDVPAEDVAHADVNEVVAATQELGLRALPAPLGAHDDVLVHDTPPLQLKYAEFRRSASMGRSHYASGNGGFTSGRRQFSLEYSPDFVAAEGLVNNAG